MPTTYAHYRFGRDVYKRLPGNIQDIIRSHGGLYNIGLHGPDLLFYYRVFEKNRVNQTGFAMHARPGIEFFRKAASVIYGGKNGKSPVCRKADRHLKNARISFIPSARYAYAFGFLCHFALDSRCHPYVERMARETGISHSEMEAELDRDLMTRDGLDPMTCRPTAHLRAKMFYGTIISGFFPAITARQIITSIRHMRLCCNLLAPSGHRLHFFIWYLMKLGHLPVAVQDMVIRGESNPACGPLVRQLERLYSQAVLEGAELIMNFMEYVEHGAPLDPRLEHTFGEE